MARNPIQLDIEPRIALDAAFPEPWLRMAGGNVRSTTSRTRAYTVGEIVDRVWARVDRSGECWLWRGSTRNGYGVISLRDGKRYIHRLVYIIYVGDLAPELLVCHRCDVRNCERPDHFFAGTAADNVADMDAKGRSRRCGGPRGARQWKFRITDEIVVGVRAAHARERPTQRALAKRFGITQGAVWAIIHRAGRFAGIA